MDQATSPQVEDIFRLLDREVWVVTSSADQDRGGLLATWVVQSSIDPQRPTVMVGLAPNHFTTRLVRGSGAFAVHLLRPDQTATALSFAIGSGHDRDKLEGLDLRPGSTGPPLLKDCLAWLDCRVFAQLTTGDRVYFWADVVAGERVTDGPALREQQLFDAAGEHQLRALRENLCDDVRLLAPLQRDWRARERGELEFRRR